MMFILDLLTTVEARRWSYSLRAANDDVDVSKIAVKYGGGGHKGAAGFASDKYVLGEMSQ